MRDLRVWAIALALFVSASAPAAALEYVFVVRHAQKTDPWTGNDKLRTLSAKGEVCASRLAEMLAGEGIAAVYSTETVRTLATGVAVSGAGPRTKILGDDDTKYTADWAEHVLRSHEEDRAVLFVGHSNTVTDLVRAFRPDTEACLEELRLAEIPDSQYGDVWRVAVLKREECAGVTRESLGQVGDTDCTTP